MSDRAQAHTLEAFTAAMLLIGGVIFALQATAVTPLSASTSNQFVENQQRTLANDLLSAAADNGSLLEAVVYWNTTSDQWEGAGENGFFTTGGPPNAFGALLNETFRDKRIAVNVYVNHWRDGRFVERTMVFMGSPSDNAVTASRTVTLYNETAISAPGATDTVSAAAANDAFYAADALPGSQLFNVVEVRIVVWRM